MTHEQSELLNELISIVRLCIEGGREAEAAMFQPVDVYRLACAFDVSIDKVHEALILTGTLYRRT